MLANRLIVLGGSANRQVAGGLLIICLIAVLVMIGVFVNAAPGGSSKALRLTDANVSWSFMGRSCQPANP